MRDTVPSTTAPTSRSAILAPFHSPGGSFPHPGRQASGHYPTPSIAASSTRRESRGSGGKVPSRVARATAPAPAPAPAAAGGGAGAPASRKGTWIGSGLVRSGGRVLEGG